MTEHVGSDLLPLYARFYFDEDVSASIVRNLRQRGFDAVCAREVPDIISTTPPNWRLPSPTGEHW